MENIVPIVCQRKNEHVSYHFANEISCSEASMSVETLKFSSERRK